MVEHQNELSKLVDQLNRSATAAKSTEKRSLDKLLALAVEQGASDVILVAGAPVAYRINGSLALATSKPLSAEELRPMLLPLLTAAQAKELETASPSTSASSATPSAASASTSTTSAAPWPPASGCSPRKSPSLESLHLPPRSLNLAERRQGLVLITGPTGSGKTSTLAALIDIINTRRRDHIVTIEDPIEYQHSNRNSIIEQIEVGHDTPDFASALRSVMRQNPDVILVGEMRDAETMATALTAAETGHLVLSTLHTNDAVQAMSRILDSFPAGNQPQIRQQLSLALVAVVWPSSLCPPWTAPAATRHRNHDRHQRRARAGAQGRGSPDSLQLLYGRAEGMMTMEQSLAELVRAMRINRETAFAHCFHTDDLRRHLG